MIDHKAVTASVVTAFLYKTIRLFNYQGSMRTGNASSLFILFRFRRRVFDIIEISERNSLT